MTNELRTETAVEYQTTPSAPAAATVSKKAFYKANKPSGEEYQIEMPTSEVVRQAILELECPPEGMRVQDTTEKLAKILGLSEEQKTAKKKGNTRTVFYKVVYTQFRALKKEGKLEQLGEARTPYFLVDETPPEKPIAPDPIKGDTFTNTIITEDTTKVLPQLIKAAKRYDVIIADPPYNIGKDFGNNTEVMPIDDYVAWAESWIRDCLHLLADDGLLYLYGLPEIIARISVRFPIHEQRWLVWHYTNKTVPSLKFWQRSHETILCLWKPNMPRAKLEIDQIRVPYTAGFLKNAAGKKRKNTPSRYGASGKSTIYNAHKNGALPRDVIKIPALAGGAGHVERWFICKTCDSQIFPPTALSEHREHDVLKHPTQKPMELTRQLILSRFNGTEGKVLIPFAGSGSECVVAQALGAEFLGIEINPEFADFAKKRLEHDCSKLIQMPLFQETAEIGDNNVSIDS